jgi:hypothetical protein
VRITLDNSEKLSALSSENQTEHPELKGVQGMSVL